ncbi:S26 family signal peptidase [Actinophytocola xanthii]|uniref:S26 family signal peptidase n=1 Tax=Actinophytocola xanthii TaxID=1912961 RepID=A0A1Q8CX05_9PSEU|nr:S26 family signal peptidase [Actinophytocola xanthii]OLF18879.1 S26 family signal peptidase [Actinophytocola xanthii]
MARAGNPLGWAPVRRIRVRGPSMAPTLRDGDVVLARRGAARVGDVVLVSWAERGGQLSVKRAVSPMTGGWFVVGDNTHASTDSRELGAATVHAVVGWRVWPRPGRLRTTGP